MAKVSCQIVRVTVPPGGRRSCGPPSKRRWISRSWLIFRFDFRAALAALDAGADKIRINPATSGGDDRDKAVADACNAKKAHAVIGVNGGSLEKHLAKYGAPKCGGMVESAMLPRAPIAEKI